MKSPTNFIPFLVLLGITTGLLFSGCTAAYEEPRYDALIDSGKDSDGGTWKTFVAGDVRKLTIPEPPSATSPTYLQELNRIVELQAKASPQDLDTLNWWAAGAVFRWNGIARELAAQYNLPPKNKPDGSYPVPDATKPCDTPRFPFANPPYTSRLLAYLNVAQYDALVAGWQAKYRFRRPPASKVDVRIKALRPATDLPTYPSEDAIVAAASLEILKAMFPCEVPYLEHKAAEHLRILTLGGRFIASDLEAGAALGKEVATLVLSRSRNDGMRSAGNPQLEQQAIQQARAAGATVVWESQDKPLRPGMLPGFGLLEPWNFDKSRVASLRPAEPPAVGSPAFEKNMEELRVYAHKLTREQHRIASFWSDGPGSYTPPGHWNRIAADLCQQGGLSELRSARAMALTATAVADAGITCWDAKYHYMYPRPFQMDSKIRTVVGLPNFPAYTSGHSTFSAAGATVLSWLFPEKAGSLEAMAKEASESRIYGTIHYRFDCEEGLVAGRKVGAFAVERARLDGAPR